MRLDKWLAASVKQLEHAGISSSRLDCLVLLEDITGKERSWLLAHPEYELPTEKVKKLDNFVSRRVNHEPLSYIRGKTEFYGRSFLINHTVLEPRPESETMIELLLSLTESKKQKVKRNLVIIDVGTGSGALAITAKLELPETEVYATDIDPKCLEVANANAKALQANIKPRQGDLLDALPPAVYRQEAVILANLPYVPDSYKINRAAESEPKHAIFGGKDGLDLYRRLFEQISNFSAKPLFLFTEALPPQHQELTNIALENGFNLIKSEDFICTFSSV